MLVPTRSHHLQFPNHHVDKKSWETPKSHRKCIVFLVHANPDHKQGFLTLPEHLEKKNIYITKPVLEKKSNPALNVLVSPLLPH